MIRPKISNLQKRNRVRALYEDEGMSIRHIAAELGVTFQAVQSLLARMGVPRRPPGGNTGSHGHRRRSQHHKSHPVVMKVLDELSKRYFIHKAPLIKKSDNLELGWGGKGGRKTMVNFTFITERPTRSEIEREVNGILEEFF
jgi:hypothetical protein